MIPDKNNQTIMKKCYTASNIAIRLLERRLKPLGVNEQLLKLHDDPGVTQGELVRADNRHQRNVNCEVNRLVALGLVDKRQSARMAAVMNCVSPRLVKPFTRRLRPHSSRSWLSIRRNRAGKGGGELLQ